MTPTPTIPPPPLDAPPSPGILAANLSALARRSPQAARAVAATPPRTDLSLVGTHDGALGGGIAGDFLNPGVQLASRYHPGEEARALVDTIDLARVATVVVLGFGLGHHVRELSTRLREYGLVICFEPDVALLRGVLERIDCSSWLERGNVVVLTEPGQPAIAEATRNCETLLAMGSMLLAHPPSAGRLGESAKAFARDFAGVLEAVRTHVVTTLVQTEITLRNQLQNLDHYATAPGIAELKGRCAGRGAILVAAGPSLARTIDLLAEPGVRDRFVIIAAQTVLKPLLTRGIRPHFVTALDHHQISKRFYEGLTPEDVRGITLVAEPKANAAILDAFPGVVRCVGDSTLDRVLGAPLAREMGSLPPGATVAHLAYYLARHLGCDPVILVGQDLGFTDGQYYAAGAAIHDVWACELSEFNTLEMMEWERIARMKSLLKRTTDQLGRPIYTDVQMHTYLVQFERDFAADAARGLRVIDATGGGVLKQHTRVMPLRDALDAHTTTGPAPDPIHPAQRPGVEARIGPVRARLRSIGGDVARLASHSRQAVDLLVRMLDHHDDQRLVTRLIGEVYEIRDRVHKLETANWLVHFLNQCGTLRRLRADRAIALAKGLSELETQRRQIERDLSNVRWLADAADQAGKLLGDALASLDGKPKVTRDDPGREEDLDEVRVESARRKVAAVLLADPAVGSLGWARDLGADIAGRNALARTLDRVLGSSEIDGVVVLTPDATACRALAGPLPSEARVEFHAVDADALHEHQRRMRAGRSWSRRCWRAGVGRLSVYDEVCPPGLVLGALREHGYDAGALLGGDWVLVDPALIDAVAARYREAPTRHRLAFSQAAPGLAPAVLDVALLEELAGARHAFASIGSLLGYVPIAPQSDPIGKPACVAVDALVRDLPVRLIADDPAQAAGWLAPLARRSGGASACPAPDIACLLRDAPAPAFPEVIHLELFTSSGQPAPLPLVRRIAEQAGGAQAAFTLDVPEESRSRVDPLSHPHAGEIISLLSRRFPVHLRTRLPRPEPAALLAGVVSVDCEDPGDAPGALDTLLAARHERDGEGIPATWIVPRITRRDEVYEQVEGFYDRALMTFGACVIDPLATPIPGQRIEPLPLPTRARAHFQRTLLRVRADGAAFAFDGTPLGNLGTESLPEVWARAAAQPPLVHTP